jgi:hypothetical protein
MAKTPSLNPSEVTKTFRKIGRDIDPSSDPKVGALLVQLVKSKDERQRFSDNPDEMLRRAGVDPSLVDIGVLKGVAESVAVRLEQIRPGDIFADTVTTKESSSNQERNFDHSSSWFANKDGYNVIYDAGHSSEKTTGEMVGQDHKFNGIEIGDFSDIIRNDLNTLFFPAQPLVTPQLVDKIKLAQKGNVR